VLLSNLRPLWYEDNQARNRAGAVTNELDKLGLLGKDGVVIFPIDRVNEEKGELL